MRTFDNGSFFEFRIWRVAMSSLGLVIESATDESMSAWDAYLIDTIGL